MQIEFMFLLVNLITPQSVSVQSDGFIAHTQHRTTNNNAEYIENLSANNFMEGYKNFREVIVEGRGIDEKQASINASKKALQQVAGVFMDVRETLQTDIAERNGFIEQDNDRFGYTQSFYSDGSIRSFKKLATRRRNGMTIVIARVSVWKELRKKNNDHPFLASNLSGKTQNSNNALRVKARGIGRTHQLALINAMEEAISSVSLNFSTIESLKTYDSIRESIDDYVSSIDVDSYTRSRTNSSKATQGIIRAMNIVNEQTINDLFIVDIHATVQANILGAYLSNVE